jgi:quercetin dioxygenase-like cupin family protein
MAKLTIIDQRDVEPAGDHGATGRRWSKLLSPPDYVLWLYLVELDAGGSITWSTDHGDEALYVFEGELDVDGRRCPAGGAVIVESGVPAAVTATTASRLGHYGSRGAASTAGTSVHVVGPEGIATFGDPADVAARFFADAGCPTCRLALFEVTRDHERPGRPHSHSADEIIYITAGTMVLGARRLGPGTALSIPGGVRYAEGSGSDGCVFLNYRREASDRTDYVKDGPPVTTPERAMRR